MILLLSHPTSVSRSLSPVLRSSIISFLNPQHHLHLQPPVLHNISFTPPSTVVNPISLVTCSTSSVSQRLLRDCLGFQSSSELHKSPTMIPFFYACFCGATRHLISMPATLKDGRRYTVSLVSLARSEVSNYYCERARMSTHGSQQVDIRL